MSLFLGRVLHGLDEERFPFLSRMVVGWGTFHILAAALDDEQVAVLDALQKMEKWTWKRIADSWNWQKAVMNRNR